MVKRMLFLGEFDPCNVRHEVGFIMEQGLIAEYVAARGYQRDLQNQEENYQYKDYDKDYIFNGGNEGVCTGTVLNWQDMESKVINGETYYIYTRSFREIHKRAGRERNVIYVYKEIPLLSDSKIFKWKEDPTHLTKEAKLIRGRFGYTCIARQDGSVLVKVQYMEHENYHRTNVTVAEFDILEATNERIIRAIKSWQDKLYSDQRKSELVAA